MAFSGPSRAAAWTLSLPTTTKPVESAILPDDGSKGSSESIIGEDLRELVDSRDMQDGGKYRSIVKIQSRFQDGGQQTWMMGSGWLIRPDLLVTAGHVVHDWGRKLGPADQIKCYIGYNGRQSVGSSQVQARYGAKVVTPVEWIEGSSNRAKDVAFIQLDRPFTGNLRLFSYLKTPETGDGTYLGVVGYPGDQSLEDEQGAQMYEEFAKSDYNIGESPRHMVEYSISTFAGQSGAPVLRNSNGQLRAIGTHSYGGGGFDSNSGTTIGNAHGNNYDDLISLFDKRTTFGDVGKVQVVQTQNQPVSCCTFIDDTFNTAQRGTNEPYGLDRGYPGRTVETSGFNEEDFFDTLKSVVNVGRDALPFASPFLGPIGGPLSAVVGTLLGSLTESRLSQSTDIETNGPAERAVLAEAAFQALLVSDHDEDIMEILDKMRQIWQAGALKTDTLAPAITPILAEYSAELSGQLAEETRNSRERFGGNRRRLEVNITESAVMDGGAAFVQGLMGPTRQLEGGGDVVEWLGPVLNIAVSDSKPLASKSTSAALSGLRRIGQEKFAIESSTSNANEDVTKILIKRAVLADAALQAVMTLPRERLDRLRPIGKDGDATSIFDFIKDAVQRLGPIAVDVAKRTAIIFGPRLLSAANWKDSAVDTEVSPPRRMKKPSMMDYLNR